MTGGCLLQPTTAVIHEGPEIPRLIVPVAAHSRKNATTRNLMSTKNDNEHFIHWQNQQQRQPWRIYREKLYANHTGKIWIIFVLKYVIVQCTRKYCLTSHISLFICYTQNRIKSITYIGNVTIYDAVCFTITVTFGSTSKSNRTETRKTNVGLIKLDVRAVYTCITFVVVAASARLENNSFINFTQNDWKLASKSITFTVALQR